MKKLELKEKVKKGGQKVVGFLDKHPGIVYVGGLLCITLPVHKILESYKLRTLAYRLNDDEDDIVFTDTEIDVFGKRKDFSVSGNDTGTLEKLRDTITTALENRAAKSDSSEE